ncbi:hypothetical protein L210DRAFT_3651033 [Boletus edulis BED1]|uniref:Uncharacterized protein n=1 Tax=Boletus edulis BED1 TaxID=1328754 RepID=A0AAD4BIM9_BOLED|nr:hypothetical protein L210DRAFT_3651033 [Boletus edulis BED1]
MLLSQEDEHSHPYWYARVCAIFHMLVEYRPDVQSVFSKPERMDVLFVRWFRRDINFDSGWDAKQLPHIQFFDAEHSAEAFGFVHPDSVIRGIHLIPTFTAGPTHELLSYDSFVRQDLLAEGWESQLDWRFFYVNMWQYLRETHHLERLQPTDYLGTSLAPLVDPSLYFTGLVNPIHQTLYLRPQPTRCASSQPLLVGHIDQLDDTSSRDLTHHLERLQPTDYLGTSLAPLVDPSLYFTGLVNPIHQTLYLRYPVGASREPFLVRRWTRQTHQTDPNQPAVPPLNPSSSATSISLMTPPPGT